jgi:hypothetical protein
MAQFFIISSCCDNGPERESTMSSMDERPEVQSDARKPYVKPEIIHELELETRAGSPTFTDPLDLLNPSSNDLQP